MKPVQIGIRDLDKISKRMDSDPISAIRLDPELIILTQNQCCGAGSRRAKRTQKNRKQLINFIF
jgi:hypothetical protein